MIFRKLADVKREQELADKSKNDSADLIETASNNSAFKKLMSKFRKKSVDSRADTEISQSVDNMGLAVAAAANQQLIANNMMQNQSSYHHHHSNSIASIASSTATHAGYNNNGSMAGTVIGGGGGSMNGNMARSITGGAMNMMGGDTNSAKSMSTSTLALATSTSGGRLLTINEKHEGEASSMQQRRTDIFGERLPTLPPLSQAQSVKQKWNILLSKAKGGVENIPKAFLISEMSEMNEQDALNEQQYQQQQQQQQQQIQQQQELQQQLVESSGQQTPVMVNRSRQPSFKITLTDSKTSNESSSNNELNNKLGGGGSSQFFQMDENALDGLIVPELGLTATKSSTSDGLSSRNPQQMLGSMIEYRPELKTDIESLNKKIGMIDKKIIDILRFMSEGGSIGGGGGGFDGGGGSGGGGSGSGPGTGGGGNDDGLNGSRSGMFSENISSKNNSNGGNASGVTGASKIFSLLKKMTILKNDI
jgi:hypothetical protein